MNVALFRVPAFVNWGAWKIRCPRCPSALEMNPGEQPFSCLECGARAEIEWPSPEMVDGIERLLLMRPDVTTQNWLPGETLVDLVVENGAHGILTMPDGYDARLIVDSERIRVDTLPATFRRELKALGGVA